MYDEAEIGGNNQSEDGGNDFGFDPDFPAEILPECGKRHVFEIVAVSRVADDQAPGFFTILLSAKSLTQPEADNRFIRLASPRAVRETPGMQDIYKMRQRESGAVHKATGWAPGKDPDEAAVGKVFVGTPVKSKSGYINIRKIEAATADDMAVVPPRYR